MTTAIKLLQNQFKGLMTEPVEGIAVELENDNFFIWRVYLEGPKDTIYEGGVYQMQLNFPQDYPMSPPALRFMSDFWHPNVYADGKVCISILHPPGDDEMSGESAAERWRPTQSVVSVLLSVQSMLNDPNFSSPANVDASVQWRRDPEGFKRRVSVLTEKANREKPPHVVIPHPDTDAAERARYLQKMKEREELERGDMMWDSPDEEVGDDNDDVDDDDVDDDGGEDEMSDDDGDAGSSDDDGDGIR